MNTEDQKAETVTVNRAVADLEAAGRQRTQDTVAGWLLGYQACARDMLERMPSALVGKER